MTVYPEPMSKDVNPYPATEPVPYDPEAPEFTDPVVPAPEPEREHLSAEEAIQRQAEADLLANPPPPEGEPPMVTRYKAGYG